MAKNWKNLRANKCPTDGNKLTRTANGYECGLLDAYYNTRCPFFITDEKKRALLDKLNSR